MLWSKAIQPWTAVRRRFHRQVEEWLSQQQARFLTCVPQNSSTKRKNYSNSRVTRGICVEVLINLQLFEEIRNFTAHRNSSSLIKNAVWRVDIEGFSPSVNLWFVAGSMWLMSRTQSHSTCWGLRQNKTHKKRGSLYIYISFFLFLIVPLSTESKILLSCEKRGREIKLITAKWQVVVSPRDPSCVPGNSFVYKTHADIDWYCFTFLFFVTCFYDWGPRQSCRQKLGYKKGHFRWNIKQEAKGRETSHNMPRTRAKKARLVLVV